MTQLIKFRERISLGKCRYSVPARLTGTRVRVRLSANELRIFDGSQQVAVHPRLAAAGAEHLELDHYLEILVRKPGALAGSDVRIGELQAARRRPRAWAVRSASGMRSRRSGFSRPEA